jgi:hypothetical protein
VPKIITDERAFQMADICLVAKTAIQAVQATRDAGVVPTEPMLMLGRAVDQLPDRLIQELLGNV